MGAPHTSSAATTPMRTTSAISTSAPRTTNVTTHTTTQPYTTGSATTQETTTVTVEITTAEEIEEIEVTADNETVVTADSVTSEISSMLVEETANGGISNNTDRQSSNPSLIILLVMFVLCGIAGLVYYLRKNKRTITDVSQKTAQDFINVRDTGNDCLYTIDGKIFVYLKINGIATEMYSERELENIARGMSAGLARTEYSYKILSVSKPVDIKSSLQMYTDLQKTADEGRKALLEQEMKELVTMVGNGDTFERQHYAVFWGDLADEEKIRKNASDFLAVLQENSISAELLDAQGIVELCNLVNIPNYVRVENRDDFTNELLNAIIK